MEKKKRMESVIFYSNSVEDLSPLEGEFSFQVEGTDVGHITHN